MSDLKESKSPLLGKPNELQSTQPATTHKSPQSVSEGLGDSGPPPPEILRSISNKEFPAWGEYLDKEKPKEYIMWKLKMIGEGHQAMTSQNAGVENQQTSNGSGMGEPSSSGSSSRLQPEIPKGEQKHGEVLAAMKKHHVSEEKES
ncbi:hypothetical protein AYL99_09358 [Fonsecaea erecta]|uniref:Uncharacterized protein n=1 Tax=Fonsecaea erecta TaxID=1367422 RepID=A0A178Z8R9_9EURO|nr:hypothetical protein AYL99_09358 [Fonsecaea erecta]OAP56179.1 hypothetical protein AYL99_09358 [Fonsecaea erecta]